MRLQGSILEIGCSEFGWMRIARKVLPDVKLVGIDWRPTERTEGVTVIQGDVLKRDFDAESFDSVVSISTIEHIGLGHYRDKPKKGPADPVDADGDIKTLQRAWTWLKPGGLLYFDVPWNPGDSYQVVQTKFRCYDDATHETRLKQSAPWRELWRGWFERETPKVRLSGVPLKKKLRAEHKQFYFLACVWQK